MQTKMSMSEAGKLGAIAARPIIEKNRQKRIEQYNLNPLKCQQCLIVMSYEKIIKRRPCERKFCSRRCSAIFNNRLFPKRKTINGVRYYLKNSNCLFCKNQCTNKFCSGKCQHNFNWQERIKEIELTKYIPEISNKQHIARKYFLYKYGTKCLQCGLTEWNNKPIPVVLDHINGNPEDFSLSNLRLLCCNCDAQTDTYKGKNKGNGRHKRRERYRNGLSY